MATDIWSSLPVLIYLMVLSHLVLSQTTQVTSEVQKKELAIEEDGGLSIESKVLGPFRIWHLVFLVVTFLLIIITIVCCCCDVRVPRTRQEIEEGYKKRIDNENYVKYLDHLPENILKNRPTARAKEKEKDVDELPARPQRIMTLGDAVMSAVPKTKLTRGGQVAVATPLAANPGVLAAMSKMRQNARSRPKQTEMAKSMTTLPKPERTRHK